MGAELHRRASAAASRAGVDEMRAVGGRQKVPAQDTGVSFPGPFQMESAEFQSMQVGRSPLPGRGWGST